MSEKNLKKDYLSILKKDFNVFEEVSGRHFSNKRMRIDAVVTPKKKEGWKNENVAFGIEFKDTIRFSESYDTKDFTKWLSQCIDYSNTEWKDFGYIYIFCCPSLIEGVPSHLVGSGMFLRNFLGQMGIGELTEEGRYGLSFLLHGHHRIWSQCGDVEMGKHWNLKRKFGSK